VSPVENCLQSRRAGDGGPSCPADERICAGGRAVAAGKCRASAPRAGCRRGLLTPVAGCSGFLSRPRECLCLLVPSGACWAVPAPLPAPAALQAAAETPQQPAVPAETSISEAINELESDVVAAMRRLNDGLDQAEHCSERSEVRSREIRGGMAELREAALQASENSSALATATLQVSEAAERVGAAMSGARDMLDNAAERAAEATAMINGSRLRPARFARSSTPSPRSPARPICSPSTPRSRRPALARPARASASSRRR
jgi:hypothetical protein